MACGDPLALTHSNFFSGSLFASSLSYDLEVFTAGNLKDILRPAMSVETSTCSTPDFSLRETFLWVTMKGKSDLASTDMNSKRATPVTTHHLHPKSPTVDWGVLHLTRSDFSLEKAVGKMRKLEEENPDEKEADPDGKMREWVQLVMLGFLLVLVLVLELWEERETRRLCGKKKGDR
ncbi:hypothetical protein ACFX14_007134 [Malus domestica]